MRETQGWVYVIDDDPSMREALSSLARSRGWRVRTFESAQAFLAHPRPQGPSCLVLDIHLPGLTGPELQQRLGKTGDAIPIICITGKADVATAVRAIKAGAVEFLTKPFDHRALLAAIEHCLARGSIPRARPDESHSARHVLAFDPFLLDIREKCLWRCSEGRQERILPSPKAFDVLQYLVERAGHLVTEDELLQAIWPNVYVQPDVVKSQLYEIRKALGDSHKEPRFIETLHRRGYRFIAAVRNATAPDQIANSGASAHHGLPGRNPALSVLRERLQLALRGQRQVAFVHGDIGIGKTALVDEFRRLAAIESPGLRVAYGHCVEAWGERETYYPVLDALESLCHESNQIVDVVAAHAPSWLAKFPALLTDEHRRTLQQEIMGATRERMLREIAQTLEIISAETPLLVVLEDLQWADGPTLDLIAALARRRTPAQLMLVGTWRPMDVPASAHPCELLTHDLLARGLCRLIDLEPLTPADIAAYLSAESAEPAQREPLARFLHRMSGGNPLFLRAALAHLSDLQIAYRTSSGWQLKTPLPEEDLPVPQSIQVIIESQLQRLAPQHRRALEAASLAVSVFSAADAAGQGGNEIEELEAVFEDLATRKRILRRVRPHLADGGRAYYEFINSLYRDMLCGQPRPGLRARRAETRFAPAPSQAVA
jgi:DNA-binding response OmpR family regulator